MKITKTISTFDCEKFEVGSLYYIHAEKDKKAFAGVYLCSNILYEVNTVLLNEIVGLSGNPPFCELRLSNDNMEMIEEINPVKFEFSYNQDWQEWNVEAVIPAEEFEDDTRLQTNNEGTV